MVSTFDLILMQLPDDDEGLKTWIYELYERKEAKLAQYYETGCYPGLKPGEGRVEHSAALFIVLHSIFLVSSLIHVTFFKRLISIVFSAAAFIRAML